MRSDMSMARSSLSPTLHALNCCQLKYNYFRFVFMPEAMPEAVLYFRARVISNYLISPTK